MRKRSRFQKLKRLVKVMQLNLEFNVKKGLKHHHHNHHLVRREKLTP